ncbi:MAG: universal stress protein [Thermodesulfobacteriota bacterium]|nr:universal stress protein [Thermodesulfobacteriota bacterium]
MARKILIAFDESENAMRAVDFVGTNMPGESSVTLFHVVLDTESICSLHSPELVPYFKSQQAAFCTLEDKKKEVVGAAMESARNALIQCGFDANSVTTKVVNREKGIARDILAEIQKGEYDLVVLGKKGLSGIKEFIMGSIPQKIVQHASGASVLLVA